VRWQDVKQVNIIIIAGREVQFTVPVSLGYFQSSSLDVLEKFLKGICVSPERPLPRIATNGYGR
jgi:hypothetical protein